MGPFYPNVSDVSFYHVFHKCDSGVNLVGWHPGMSSELIYLGGYQTNNIQYTSQTWEPRTWDNMGTLDFRSRPDLNFPIITETNATIPSTCHPKRNLCSQTRRMQHVLLGRTSVTNKTQRRTGWQFNMITWVVESGGHFGWDSLTVHYLLGWPTGGKGRYKLPSWMERRRKLSYCLFLRWTSLMFRPSVYQPRCMVCEAVGDFYSDPRYPNAP